jgi:acyl carrier protein
MIHYDAIRLTHDDLRSASSDHRPQLLEDYLVASIAALRPPGAPGIDASAHLADLGIDSLQVVELKFGLDQLLGEESDVAIIIANPTIRELAQHSVRAARALT